jgi:hypothetical protein
MAYPVHSPEPLVPLRRQRGYLRFKIHEDEPAPAKRSRTGQHPGVQRTPLAQMTNIPHGDDQIPRKRARQPQHSHSHPAASQQNIMIMLTDIMDRLNDMDDKLATVTKNQGVIARMTEALASTMDLDLSGFGEVAWFGSV